MDAETPRVVPDGHASEQTFLLGASSIDGWGALAARTFGAGEAIGVSHYLRDGGWRSTVLGRFHNHSTAPTARNVQVGDLRYLVATRILHPGVEVTVDYTLQPDLEQPQAGWQ